MKRIDPYEELGISRDATAAEIKKAGRRAAKRTHPDAGGNVDAFQRSRRAEMCLLDPVRREKFDRTGTIEDDKPDNRRVAALQVIERFIGPILMDYINSGFAYEKDPRRRDLFAEFRAMIDEELHKLAAEIKHHNKTMAFLRDMTERFSSQDKERPIERSLERQIDNIEVAISNAKMAEEMRKLALEIIGKYKFKRDDLNVSSDIARFFIRIG